MDPNNAKIVYVFNNIEWLLSYIVVYVAYATIFMGEVDAIATHDQPIAGDLDRPTDRSQLDCVIKFCKQTDEFHAVHVDSAYLALCAEYKVLDHLSIILFFPLYIMMILIYICMNWTDRSYNTNSKAIDIAIGADIGRDQNTDTDLQLGCPFVDALAFMATTLTEPVQPHEHDRSYHEHMKTKSKSPLSSTDHDHIHMMVMSPAGPSFKCIYQLCIKMP